MRTSESNGDVGLQMAPWLSVMFVLLLFFWVTSPAFFAKPEGVVIAKVTDRVFRAEVPVIITIDDANCISVSGSQIANSNDHVLQDLVVRLKGVVAANATQPVLITPVLTCKQQRLIDVLNACAAAGVRNVTVGGALHVIPLPNVRI